MILLTYAYIKVKKIENKIDKTDKPSFGNQVEEWNHIFKFIPGGEGAKIPLIKLGQKFLMRSIG